MNTDEDQKTYLHVVTLQFVKPVTLSSAAGSVLDMTVSHAPFWRTTGVVIGHTVPAPPHLKLGQGLVGWALQIVPVHIFEIAVRTPAIVVC